MKRLICFLLSIGLLLGLAACQGEPPQNDAATDTETETNQQQEPAQEKLLTLEKTEYDDQAESPANVPIRMNYSCVTLGQADENTYPKLAEALRQLETMQKKAMQEEFDNLIAFAQQAADSNALEPYVSTQDVQVRRADQAVLSLLFDSYSANGQGESYRALRGRNYDPQSGEELALTDVVKEVNNDLALAVQEALTAHMLTGTFHSETTVEDYFANTPYGDYNWTVDYSGVTFYFASGELNDEGARSATVSFAKYPELFYEKYSTAPSAYTVELPLDSPFYTQLDGDAAFESLSVSAYFDEEQGQYTEYGVYTDADDGYFEDVCTADTVRPYFVKASDGNSLYLFCEKDEETRLLRFSLKEDGGISKSAEQVLDSAWRTGNKVTVPTDPDAFTFNAGD